ncbi:hypothetical protein PSN45_002448 [Yamadazyma tenuis]|uniref:Uncharacterized protein n=1 Tax=Candida tenuis (strain ATCC 10573 / BCRC 21748 / CBS 615 / JCM 9827 / NBRC 10315 / NRRL Y-1498 / VKM Y-70) TaxID=590646 RepID=G3B0F2_CANTC|nr:uncharacterized protein CANTEDRAFT_97291 [Yamadazyma tenuis ATCC 10573]EGV65388.1 hypothetical protein CANTEDRAFT_97291 [Yamadazyma tenuis ATCC 10573]WEJ94945.1 hypothetical protein PSN45_002448 [Yamadazyma tenuis]
MSMAIAPVPTKGNGIPLGMLLSLNRALKKTILSPKFYQELNDKVLTKASTIDSVLYFTCYFALLVSSILNNKTSIRRSLQDQRLKLVKLVETRFGVSLASSPNKWLNRLAVEHQLVEKPSTLGKILKNINTYVADVRIFNRLGDCIKYVPWIAGEFNAFLLPSSDTPKFTRFINLLQSLNCFVLELLENAGWLTEHDWVATGDNNWWCIFTYIWCCRVWGVYILVEIMELLRRTPVKDWNRSWKISMFKQVIQMPLVLHWSLYDGCLTPFWVGVCGCGASWWGFRDVMASLQL